jgi:hypothetical protein
MKHSKSEAKVGAMVRYWNEGKHHYGILASIPSNENIFPYYRIRNCISGHMAILRNEDFTIHKA